MPIDPRSRRTRLEQDYSALSRLRGTVFDFEGFTPPAPEQYTLKYKLKSVMGIDSHDRPIYSSTGHVHRLQLNLPPQYPLALRNEDIKFLSDPIFHPNVFRDGHVCIRDYNPGESLSNFVIRIAKYIQFDPAFTGPDSPANIDAREWYVTNMHLFPVDVSRLPDPDRFVFGQVKKSFQFGRVVK